jgi:carbonic anhydrase
MTNFDPLLDRNPTFAATEAHVGLSPMPRHQVFVMSCIDARVDPAVLLNLDVGDALVLRNAGGRVTDEAIQEIAFIGAASALMAGDAGPATFEVAILHHNACGTGFYADEDFRNAFAEKTGADPGELLAMAVLDPTATVKADVQLLRSSPQLPSHAVVSGHVYDVDTGLIKTIIPAE